MPSSLLSQRLISRLPRSLVEGSAAFLRKTPFLKRVYVNFTSSLKGRDGTIAAGPARGLRFNPGQSDSRFLLGNFEPALQEIVAGQLQPGMVFYDVGANVGFLAILAARLVGNTGAVHCFEPLPANAEQIRHNARLNGFDHVQVHAVALADRDATASFRVSERPTFGALADSPMEVDQQIGTIEVPVRRLDNLIKELQLQPPDMMKIDVEGSEIDLLAGAQDMIRRFRPILMIELHGTNDGVASWLKELSYDADVVGGGPLATAPWAALAIATPKERSESRALVTSICQEFHGR